MPSDRALRQYLDYLQRSGISHVPRVTLPPPKERRTRPSESKLRRPSVGTPATRPGSLRSPGDLRPDSVQKPPVTDTTSEVLARPLKTADQKSQALCDLAAIVSGCTRCKELADTRTQTVFGVGNADATIMFIGEAPGADEDQQGEPFVGRAGKLLDQIIEASQLKREDIYICNILRCRPPGNRNPLPQEAGNCREYLDAQIQVVNPDYIVCWGTVAAQNLLGEKRPIGKLRKQFLVHGNARVLCTYHPSYLLRNPSAKSEVWDDMKFFMKDMGVELN